ncbi:MAG TPA: hypothetical protein VGE74_21025 [Gemmata sp.]
MIRPEDKPEDLCKWFTPILAQSLRLRNRSFLRYSDDREGLHITIGSKEADEETEDNDPALPDELKRKTRPKHREVFKILAELWAERDGMPDSETCVMPVDIIERQWVWHQREMPPGQNAPEPPRSTVMTALAELRTREVVYQHGTRGWVIGRKQARLTDGVESVPREKGYTSAVEPAPIVSQTARVARDCREHASRELSMYGKQIWVPGEKDDFQTGGLIVTDADGNTHLLEGKQERMRYAGSSGRLAAPFAVKCDLVTVEDAGRYQIAHVKVRTPDGRKQIRVKVLGDWHIEGRLSDRAEPAALAAN